MILLLTFAFLAGAATALSPCALPVLPVVFSAGSTGGRRRPAGVAIGLAVSFTFAVVVLVYIIAALGLPDTLLRSIAIVILLAFGISLIVPQVGDRVETLLSRMTSRSAGKLAQTTQSRADGKDGFWSGFLVGGGLGFVYAPCAGPILAGVITVTASQELTAERLFVALAYGIGSAATFFVLMLGGRKLIAPLVKRSPAVQTAMGVTMVALAFAMFANLDTRFQTTIADKLPAALVNPTGSLEESSNIQDSLADANGKTRSAETESSSSEDVDTSNLPVIGPAPDFVGNQKWFNTLNGEPLSISELRGKVVLVDFWTYTCINCIRTLPALKKLWASYRNKGLVIVGVHSPEFPFERSASNVEEALEQNELTYPVAQDNEFATWNAYSNEFWPSKFLIDANGNIRYAHIGEGEYEETDAAVRSLLAEAGESDLGDGLDVEGVESASAGQLTPETYLGSARAAGFLNGPITEGENDYRLVKDLDPNTLSYGGRWQIDSDSATSSASSSRLDLNFNARRVFLVLGTEQGAKKVNVLLDGKPIESAEAGRQVRRSMVTVKGQKLYSLVDLPKVENRTLSLRFPPGVSGYAFTFG